MVNYFAYGSNMNLTSLRAKGVEPGASQLASLRGWRLAFDVRHWFRHEGGVGNIHPSGQPDDVVRGVVHMCNEEHLLRLDAVESRGVGYDRAEVVVDTADGQVQAIAYVGVPSYLDASCLPTQRYLNILVSGAEAAGLEPDYIEGLRNHPIYVPDDYPPFAHPDDAPELDRQALAEHPLYTAVYGAVFDMSGCSWRLECVHELFGGRDTTLFHLHRHDSSDGSETLDDIKHGRIDPAGREYLNAYAHEYAAEFRYVGRYVYD